MIIKLTAVNDCMIGGKFPGKEIEGVRIDNGERWGKNFFADKRELRNQLEEFGLGDTLNVKLVQDGKFWNIESITEASDALIAKAKEFGSKGNKTEVGFVSKDEGYKKTNVYNAGAKYGAAAPNKDGQIARAVALKAAIEFLGGKAKMTEDKLIASAEKFVPFLMDTVDKGDVAPDSDPLAPPKE